VIFRPHALAEFWDCYDALPKEIRVQPDKQYALFSDNPDHPSLRLKRAGPYWSVRVGRGYRALARQRRDDFFWFWIGSHDDYQEILKRA